MKLETRRAALRAAQAVAGLGFLACSRAAPPEAATVPASDVPNKTLAPASSGAPTNTNAGSNGACLATVQKFFPGDDDPYEPNKHVTAPREVERCCHAAMLSYGSAAAPREMSLEDAQKLSGYWRWRCCTTIDQTKASDIGSACTPWGPPVPPPMRKRAALFVS